MVIFWRDSSWTDRGCDLEREEPLEPTRKVAPAADARERTGAGHFGCQASLKSTGIERYFLQLCEMGKILSTKSMREISPHDRLTGFGLGCGQRTGRSAILALGARESGGRESRNRC